MTVTSIEEDSLGYMGPFMKKTGKEKRKKRLSGRSVPQNICLLSKLISSTKRKDQRNGGGNKKKETNRKKLLEQSEPQTPILAIIYSEILAHFVC